MWDLQIIKSPLAETQTLPLPTVGLASTDSLFWLLFLPFVLFSLFVGSNVGPLNSRGNKQKANFSSIPKHTLNVLMHESMV